MLLEGKHIRKPLSSTDPSKEMKEMRPVCLKLAVSALAPLQKLLQIIQIPTMNTKKPLSPLDPTTEMEDIHSLDEENKSCSKSSYIDPIKTPKKVNRKHLSSTDPTT